MKRIIFSIFVILSAMVFSVSAQTAAQKAFGKGMISANDGKFETALSEFQTSLAYEKNSAANDEFLAKIHFNIGVCFYKLKRSAEAAQEYEFAVLNAHALLL